MSDIQSTSLQSTSLEEIRLYAERYGLKDLPEDQFSRLAELAQTVRETGLALPRMPSEEDEPAHLFSVQPR
jgi:aspartyl-tRNA(Asn)/glutamyl-tRNA(Gln) amidotransferase subunit A